MKLASIVFIIALFAPSLFAQDPIAQDSEEQRVASEQDTRPIGGAESIGLQGMRPGFALTPGLWFSQSADSFGDDFEHVSTLAGTLQLSEVRNRQRFALNYDGGGIFSTRTGQESASYQTLRVSQSAGIGRWTFSVFDSVNYTPDSAGFTTTGIPGFSPSMMPSLNGLGVASFLLPGQDVATTNTPRVSNSLAGQVQYAFSYRNSLTVGAAHGLLRFLEHDFLNSKQYSGFASFERMLDAHNTAGVKYIYTAVTYDDFPLGMHSNAIQATFGRRITQRMVADVALGPQIISAPQQKAGTRSVGWASDLGLTYARDYYSVGLSFARQFNAGSGVTFGARTDSVMLTASRQWARRWHTFVDGGYSRNVALTGEGVTYSLRTVGGGLQRQVTRSISLDLHYSGQYQTTNTAITSSAILGGWRHSFGIALHWHPDPLIARQ